MVNRSAKSQTHTYQISHESDAQLLARLIGARRSEKLYRGSLRPLFFGNAADGPAQKKCAIARELVIRSIRESMAEVPVLHCANSVRDYLRLTLSGLEYEVFVAIFVNAQNHLIAADEMFRGTLTQTSVYPREVVKAALRHNAAGVVFAHNHPSGKAEPSSADRQLTRSLSEALQLVDVRVLDHFIVAGPTIYSFAEAGLLH